MKKDLCLKRFLLDKRRFADVINGFIGGGELLILPEDLSLLGTQSESTRTQKYRDRLTQAAFGVNFMVIGIEGQESTHYLMPLRCMSYDATEYERQAAEIKKEVRLRKGVTREEWLSGFGKTDRLKPCVTIVLYFGEEWDGAMRLHELIDFTDIPSKLKTLINDYPIHILEIQKLTDTTMFQTDVKQVFDAIRFSKDPEKFKELIKTDPAFKALDIEAYDVIMQYTRAKEFGEIKEKVIGEEKVDMCKALTLLLEDERTQGKKEGIKEGIKEGETRACLVSVKNLMANLNLTLEQTMEMLGMEPEMRMVCRNRLR